MNKIKDLVTKEFMVVNPVTIVILMNYKEINKFVLNVVQNLSWTLQNMDGINVY